MDKVDTSADACWIKYACNIFDNHARYLGWETHEYSQTLRALIVEHNALKARVAELGTAIKMQAGAAKRLRSLTLDEVQHLRDQDRSEYTAAKTVDSERAANAILTDENDALKAQNEALIAERTNLIATKRQQIAGYKDDIAAQAAEIERLRKALQYVVNIGVARSETFECQIMEAQAIASNALKVDDDTITPADTTKAATDWGY